MNKDLGELLSPCMLVLPELPGLRNVWAAIRKSAGVKAVPSAGGYLPPLACAAALCCAGKYSLAQSGRFGIPEISWPCSWESA